MHRRNCSEPEKKQTRGSGRAATSTPDVHVCPVRMCGVKPKPLPAFISSDIWIRTFETLTGLNKRSDRNLEEGTAAEPGLHFCPVRVHVHVQVQVHGAPSPA